MNTAPVIDTIAHSTRPQEEFIAVLRHYAIVTLVDIRSMPRSRHNPRFNREELEQAFARVTGDQVTYPPEAVA